MPDSPVRPSGSGPRSGSEQNPSLLRFGVFEIDLRTCELRKRGVRVRLQRQPFKVLVRLASGGGDLVTRGELQAGLWGGDTFVDFDQGLNFCVKQIRRALGDDAQSPRYVETLPRQGYRFVAPVSRGAAVLHLVQGGASEETPRSGPSERSVAVTSAPSGTRTTSARGSPRRS